MDSNSSQKRRGSMCEPCHQKWPKLAHDDSVNLHTTVEELLLPKRARRIGGLSISPLVSDSHQLVQESSIPKNAYTYEPILSGQMRLLRVSHTEEAEIMISCSLRTVSLDYPPKFEALSYTWGHSAPRQSIMINGQPFQVTSTLMAALKRLRRKDRPVDVWIDATCIDQASTMERNQQIPNMTTIYHKADQVCVWLGLVTLIATLPWTSYQTC